VAFIEGGWPGSNPKDVEFFERARDLQWKNALVAAFGSTCRVKGGPEDDANIKALLDSQTPVCTIFGKTWTLHVREVLLTTLEDNLRIIEQSVAYLKANGKRVIYDAEHFFDGYKADSDYALETLQAAIRGGAETIVLCDTNGGTMPWEVECIIQGLKPALAYPFGIHTHNDSECAVINSLTAIREGAMQVQGTINGVGERCGNANLVSIMADLELKMGYQCLPEGNICKLYDLSHFVAEVANITPDEHLPFVGKSAFAHKGGVHVAAMRRSAKSYQHVQPELVGNRMRVVVSDLSGRGNLLSKAEEHGLEVEGDEVVSVLMM
jgi:2-isopropylmalate synthase